MHEASLLRVPMGQAIVNDDRVPGRSMYESCGMLSYTLRRLLGAIPVLFVVVTVTFFLMRLAPGGPFDQEQTLTPEIQANLEAAYGLDQPRVGAIRALPAGTGARRLRTLVPLSRLHRHRAHCPGTAHHPDARPVRGVARTRNRSAARHPGGIASERGERCLHPHDSGARHRVARLRGRTAPRTHFRHLPALAARGGLGDRIGAHGGVAGDGTGIAPQCVPRAPHAREPA